MKFLKKCFLSTFMVLLFSSANLMAQSYKSLLKHFNEWHITTCFFGCITDVYFTDEIRNINGYNYHVLGGYHYINRNFLLREDTLEKQVFWLTTELGSLNREYLLYDFSLLPGDSILVFNPISPFPDSAGYYVVDSVVPKAHIDGETYRYFYLSASDSVQAQSSGTVWVEGIGSLNLINIPGAYPNLNGTGALSCFFNQEMLRYSNLDSITGCIQAYPNLSVDEIPKALISLYPNPASSIISINAYDQKIRIVKIYNIQGQEVNSYQITNLSKIDLNVDFLSNGIFLIHIETKDGNVILEKLIIQ